MKTMQQTYKPILKLYWLGHTTLAIVHSVEKPHILMTIVILIFGLVFAVYLMRLAFLNFGKEKYPTSTLLAVLAVVAFCFSMPSFQSFARTWMVHDVNSRLLALGNKLDEVQNAISGMHNQLTEHQNQIESH